VSIAATLDAIEDVLATVSGLERVYRHKAESIESGDLPAAVTYSGPTIGNGSQFGGATFRQTDRAYIIDVYVRPIVEATWEENIAEAETLLDACVDAFLTLTNITLSGAVTSIESITDTGVVVMTLGNNTYTGFQLTLACMGKTVQAV
jgi:hypothetical protein